MKTNYREWRLLRKQRSEWKKKGYQLKDYPIAFIDEEGRQYVVKDPEAARSAA